MDTKPVTRPSVPKLADTISTSLIAVVALASACGEQPQPTPSKSPSGSAPTSQASSGSSELDPALQARLPVPAVRKQVRHEVAEQVGSQLIWCTPAAASDDVKARDAAANALLHLGVLSDATEDTVIWGVLRHDQVGDAVVPRGLQLDPSVWAGCYLSCFVFSSVPKLEQVGDTVTLSVAAEFRDKLPAGDYPHPLWHSGNEWESYCRTSAIEFVFTGDRLLAAFRREDPAKTITQPPREWDGHWRWKEGMYLKPRTADFATLFSEDNPHVLGLDRAYQDLNPVFAAHNCLDCHTPDNPAGSRSLLVLALPNQAIAARAQLASILIGESDGPDSTTHCNVASLLRLPNSPAITDAAVRFLEEGDAATEYEWIRLIRKGEDSPRISP